MYVATVVDLPKTFGKHLPELGKIKRPCYDIFHSEGLFSPMGEEGHSLLVLYEDFNDFQCFAADLGDLIGIDIYKGFCYFGDRNSVPKGNRRAEVIFTPIKSRPGASEYQGFLQRLNDYQEYLQSHGDLFTCPGTDELKQFFHSLLIITQPDTKLFGHASSDTKVYNEL